MNSLNARAIGARFTSAVQRINHPVYRGSPNPAHGKFFIVGSIPADCYDKARNGGAGGSRLYDTEDEAIAALVAAGALDVQRCDCSFAIRAGKRIVRLPLA